MQRIALSAVHLRNDARKVDPAAMKSLAESMAEIGLLSPIRVRERDGGYELCAGNHRYEAAVSLGWEEIDAIVEEFGDLDAELVMIDENLCRSELSPADRAHYTARRKAIYLEKHPETAVGGDRKSDEIKSQSLRPDRFTADTAKKTGQSERVVQLNAERGEKIARGVLTLIRGTHLDNGVYLDGLKKLSPDEQRAKVEHDLASEKKRQTRRKTKIADAPLSEEEARENWLATGIAWWNKGSLEWREEFRARIDTPVMDAAKQFDDGIPDFLRRAR